MTLKIGALELECMNDLEAGLLGDDVALYFEEGIELVPGMTVLDVGANIGAFSAEVHQRVGGDLRLWAFEPMPPVYAVLARNLELLGPHAKALPFGLGKEEAELEFGYFPAMTVLSSSRRNDDNLLSERARIAKTLMTMIQEGRAYPLLRFLPPEVVEAIVVGQLAQLMQVKYHPARIRRLSTVIDEAGIGPIDLLKIDVEGAELDVLEGIEDRHWPQIRQLLLECERWTERSPKVRAILEDQGFEVTEQRQAAQVAGDFGLLIAKRP